MRVGGMRHALCNLSSSIPRSHCQSERSSPRVPRINNLPHWFFFPAFPDQSGEVQWGTEMIAADTIASVPHEKPGRQAKAESK